MPLWALPLLTVVGSALAAGLVAAGTQLSMGASWHQVLGAFLAGAGTGGALHALPSPFQTAAGGGNGAAPIVPLPKTPR